MKKLYLVYFLVTLVALTYSLTLTEGFQDSWVLESIWLPVFIILLLYLVILVAEDRLEIVAVITSLTVFVLYLLPAVKYMYLYGSTVDVASHSSFTYAISSSGKMVWGEPYSYAPGFHATVAILSQLSGITVDRWLRIFPPLLASLVPLGVGVLCQTSRIDQLTSKILLILSIFCLPNFYTLNGTTFTSPFIVIILIIAALRENDNRLSIHFTLTLVTLLVFLIFWHPPSSLLFPSVLFFVGLFSSIKIGNSTSIQTTKKFISSGLLGLVGVTAYWMYHAQYIWNKFIANIVMFINADTTPSLIPTKLFELEFDQQLMIVLLYHARDFLYLALALCGLAVAISSWKKDHLNHSEKNILAIFALVFVAFMMLILGVFIVQFGSQGYKRFLFYLVAVSFLPAGFGLSKIVLAIRNQIPAIPLNGFLFASGAVIISISCIQLYPYQPAVPSSSNANTPSSDPVVWLHQVNTSSQFYAIQFGLRNLPSIQDQQFLIDYVGFRQARLFFGASYNKLAMVRNARSKPGYILLHTPGKGGAYSEQVEYRNVEAMTNLRSRDDIDTIYDNGLSYILFYPDNISALSLLEK